MPPLFAGYFPHLVYSIANVSLSLHLLYQKNSFADEKARVNAQESVLQSIADELKSNAPLSQDDLQRLRRLVRNSKLNAADSMGEEISWKDALLGRSKYRRSDQEKES